MDKEIKVNEKFANDPLFQEVMKEALEIQDRFCGRTYLFQDG